MHRDIAIQLPFLVAVRFEAEALRLANRSARECRYPVVSEDSIFTVLGTRKIHGYHGGV